jgi:acyl carrier protein
MDPQNFIQNFAEQFEEVNPAIFSFKTRFRDVEGWSSLIALSIIAMVDEAYNVKLTGDDVRKSVTVEDIYLIIESKL